MPSYRHLRVEDIGDVRVAHITGPSVNSENATQLREELVHVIDGCQKIILNLSAVTYINSDGLRQIILLHKELQKRAEQLRLCHLQDVVDEVFRLTRLDRLMTICSDQQAALESF